MNAISSNDLEIQDNLDIHVAILLTEHHYTSQMFLGGL
jgi:hypothetical protein